MGKRLNCGVILDDQNKYKDFDMTKICGCDVDGKEHLLSYCEKYCAKYYSCDNVAIADDVIKEKIG